MQALDAAQRRLVRTETTIATCLCSLLPSAAIFLLFDAFPVSAWGTGGLVAFAAKSTGVAVLLMTTLMSVGTRNKVSKGAVPQLQRARLAWLRVVPRMLALRVLLYAAMAAAVMSALTALLVLALEPAPLQRPAFVAFNLVVGALIGLCMTPLIQCAALADEPRRAVAVPSETT